MSLFPAYSSEVNEQDITENRAEINNKSKWLENSSYEIISANYNFFTKNNVEVTSSDEDSSNEVIDKNENEEIFKTSTVHLQNKKKKKKVKTCSRQYKTYLNNVYFEDKERNAKFCTLETLESSLKPNYKLSSMKIGFDSKKQIKSKRFQRYHILNKDVSKNINNDKKKSDNTENITNKLIDHENESKLQFEQKSVIEKFNQKLLNYPKDIDTWIEYVTFQDEIAQMSLHYNKKEISKQLINQKKLSIVEKGLAANHDSIELLKMKLYLLSELLPADQFLERIETMIQKNPKNIILWQTLISTIQKSCALCKITKVLNLYVKYFSILKQKSKIDSKFYDEQILDLLYQCLIFLRHAGLWEQMWEIIRLNLCLNLAMHHDTLQSISTIDEKTIIKMEEVILNSELPLNQLWLRIESLRESCYWISADLNKIDINLIGDEKRLVSNQETIDFIYPTISKNSNFRLVIFSILCLKIPLLPSRHCTLKDFKLEEHFWSIDSLEFILPMIYPTVSTADVDNRLNNTTVIRDLLEGKLTSGPQFLKFHPVQELFLNFIRLIFNTVAQKLPILQRTSILIWWLRFERLLIFLNKHDSLSDSKHTKKVKSILKDFFKKSENRNNLHFYREFALIERELGFFDKSVQILKTIILSQESNNLNYEEKIALISLYRTIFEIILNSNSYKESNLEIFQEMIKSLEAFVFKCFSISNNGHMSVTEILYNEILKFLMNPVEDEPEEAFLLPNIHCDMLICYAYILQTKNSITDDIIDVLDLFDKCILHCNNCLRLQERFYETKVTFLQFHQYKFSKSKNILIKTLNEALDKFSNNFFFLTFNALNENELPFWKLKMQNKKLNIWSILANCLAGRARIAYLKHIESEGAFQGMINKMLSFHRIVSKTQNVQNCPLVWRFYMLLLQEYGLCEKKGEEIYYEAIAQCPWTRSVYISAAEIAPQILSEIQDLIKEKELRIYVTSEELDILRK